MSIPYKERGWLARKAGLDDFAGSTVLHSIGAWVALAGIIVVYSVLFFERIKVDDPVGAVSVHGVCGAPASAEVRSEWHS